MIAMILLLLAGASRVPTVEALAERESRASALPCGVDEELEVPSEVEIEQARQAAILVGIRPTFHRMRVELTARGIIRKRIGRRDLGCDEVIEIHDAALEQAEELVTKSEPRRRGTSARNRPRALERMMQGGAESEVQNDSE